MPTRLDPAGTSSEPPGQPVSPPDISAGTAGKGGGAGPRRPTRMPRPRFVLGVRAGQLMAWQLTAVAAVAALAQRGPVHWALEAVALLGCCVTVPRWRHRWAYEWLVAMSSFHRARRAPLAEPASAPPESAPSGTGPSGSLSPGSLSSVLAHLDIIPARIPNGADAGVVHDGDGFAVIIALTPQPGAAPVTELPVARLASLLDQDDAMVSAVQVILHADLAADDATSSLATAYRSLCYNRVPRSASAWIVLRHDPAVCRYAIAAAGTTSDVQAGVVRGLATRGVKVADLIGDLQLRGQVLGARAARELLTTSMLTGEAAAPAGHETAGHGRPHRWRSWHSGTRQHVTYWVRRWPTAGLDALQRALASVPALVVTTSVVIARAEGGQIGLTATVRVTTGPAQGGSAVARAVTAAAASCGARLARMDGEHADGVLATLPLGRGPAGPWLGWHVHGRDERSPTAALPLTAGGVVLGAQDDDDLVAVPFFTAERATLVTVIGDPLLPRLIALRALGTGARLQVVTTQPAGWLKLRDHAQVPPERMPVVRPGTQAPADGTRADPWMIIDDTGSPEPAGSHPWQAVVTVLGQPFEPSGLVPGQDAVVLQRTSAAGAAAVVKALGLTGPAAQTLESIPDGLVAVARPAAVRYAWLAPDLTERAVLTGSLQA